MRIGLRSQAMLRCTTDVLLAPPFQERSSASPCQRRSSLNTAPWSNSTPKLTQRDLQCRLCHFGRRNGFASSVAIIPKAHRGHSWWEGLGKFKMWAWMYTLRMGTLGDVVWSVQVGGEPAQVCQDLPLQTWAQGNGRLVGRVCVVGTGHGL